jgi:hypothetical protein
MRTDRSRSARRLAALSALLATLLVPTLATDEAAAAPAAVSLPPAHAGFDYQIGGAYPPPAGVSVVSRDHDDAPTAGLYNICYVNAFQVQPGAEGDWDSDLLLHDANGEVVYDQDWGEALLDTSTAAKRRRIADTVDGWIDECAAKGYQAIEPDNYDSYSRSEKLLTSAEAEAYITLLSAHAHSDGLAIAQKNTSEIARIGRDEIGFDFVVAEECFEWDECDVYADVYDNRVMVIEYERSYFDGACRAFGGRLAIVLRDVPVSAPGSRGYQYDSC